MITEYKKFVHTSTWGAYCMRPTTLHRYETRHKAIHAIKVQLQTIGSSRFSAIHSATVSTVQCTLLLINKSSNVSLPSNIADTYTEQHAKQQHAALTITDSRSKYT
eukprot:Lankesteria_metandrocarpae@DN5158_c0_g1_i11.p1